MANGDPAAKPACCHMLVSDPWPVWQWPKFETARKKPGPKHVTSCEKITTLIDLWHIRTADDLPTIQQPHIPLKFIFRAKKRTLPGMKWARRFIPQNGRLTYCACAFRHECDPLVTENKIGNLDYPASSQKSWWSRLKTIPKNIIFHSNWSLTNLFIGYSCSFWFGVCWWPKI